jgi:hypothetical protein
MSNTELLTVGADADDGANKIDNTAIDELEVYDFELSEAKILKLSDSLVGTNTLISLSGLSLQTPPNSDTSDATQGNVIIKTKVKTGTNPSTLSHDPSSTATISGASNSFTFGKPIITTAQTFDPTENILKVTIPYSTTTEVNPGATLGTITIPLQSSAAVTSVTATPGSPVASSTLLEAKAQAVRYILSTHSIGSSSGQAELRGNDAILSLGEGFGGAPIAGHTGSTGSDDEIAGTMLHEIGHLLNLQHAGPRYELSNPTVTLASSAQNCVPIHNSVMSYSGQLPNFKGANWTLDFNGVDFTDLGISPVSENALNEFDGFTIVNSPYVVWATPNSLNQAFLGGLADGSSLDFSGDGIIQNVVTSYDLNNYGFVGCQASPGSSYDLTSEWDNLDYNYRQGPSGQFDGFGGENSHGKGQSELGAEETAQQKKLSAGFVLIPPPALDGTETRNPGAQLPLKFTYYENDAIATPIIDAEVEARLWEQQSFDNDGDGEFDEDPRNGIDDDGDGLIDEDNIDAIFVKKIGTFSYSETNQHYELKWKSDRKNPGVFGIQYVVIVNEGSERLLRDPANLHELGDYEVSPGFFTSTPVTVIVTLE